jgi:hypothetical protein
MQIDSDIAGKELLKFVTEVISSLKLGVQGVAIASGTHLTYVSRCSKFVRPGRI